MRVKTFSTHVVVKKRHDVRKMAGFTHGMSNIELDVREKRFSAHTEPGNHIRKTSQGGDGGWSRHWLPKREGTHSVGRTGGTLRPRPGLVTGIGNCHWRKSINVTFYDEFRPFSAVK